MPSSEGETDLPMLCLPQACGKHLRRDAEVRAHNDDRLKMAHAARCVGKTGNCTTVCVKSRSLQYHLFVLCPILWLCSSKDEVFLSGTPCVFIGPV